MKTKAGLVFLRILPLKTAKNRHQPPRIAPTGCNFQGGKETKEEVTIVRREQGTIGHVAREIREEAKRQLHGFPRESKYQLRGVGG